MIGRKCVQVGS